MILQLASARGSGIAPERIFAAPSETLDEVRSVREAGAASPMDTRAAALVVRHVRGDGAAA